MRVFAIRLCLLIGALAFVTALNMALAEEGGSGHYTPGSLASTVDMIPAEAAFVARLNASQYDGSANSKGLKVPIAGVIATDVDVETKELALHLVWNPGWEGTEEWSYAMAMSLPYVSTTVSANIDEGERANSNTSRRVTDKNSGIGDLVLQPLMVSYAIEKYWQSDFRFAIYTPTGGYERGRLANTGKNYWTFSPALALIHIEPAIGREFSVFGGIDFNTKNTDTDYHTGTQFHIDSTFVQYVILLGGFSGIGISGYWYQQLTGDSGSGATQGDFKSQALGVGPVLSYRAKWASTKIIAELKWLHEFETKRRYNGDTFSLKIRAEY
ncbi:transporter [Photobacterium sp. SDRW27]|uniref:SphA family protein n=1 Tax=Photobacterium obscurum TaxID=2829490 RepID=UPI0022432CC7|nr:transporter [Photobacterium obscurum]MCW8331436.1 transporter [Photobacterium obscurum]